MKIKKGRKLFSLNYLFASFFGALMIALSFAYFNYKFSEYKFIDFNKWIFYKKKDIFTPKYDKYLVLVYSSNQIDFKKVLKKFKTKYPVLAVDLYQRRFDGNNSVICITSGINTILKFIQRFNVYEVPSAFIIRKERKKLYKQDSRITILE